MCRTKPKKKRRLTLVLFTLNTNLLWVKNENFLFRIPFNWAEKELIIKRKDRNLQFLAKLCLRSVYVTSRQFYGLLQWNRFYFQFDFYYVLGVGTTHSSVCFQNKVQWCDFDEIFQSLQNIIIVAKIKSIEGVRRLVKLKKFAFIQPLAKGSYKKSWTDKKCQLKRLLPLINWHLFCVSFKLFVSIVWMCKLSLVSFCSSVS